MSTKLTEFLLARIAEDEAAARRVPFPHSLVTTRMEADGHYLRWGAGRVLAECEAKRLLIERVGNPDWAGFRFLALPYADHPDYPEELKS